MGKFSELLTTYDLNEAVLYLLDLPIENAETIAIICGFLNGDHLISKSDIHVPFETTLELGFSAEQLTDYTEARIALERAISRSEILSEPVYHGEDGYPDNYLIKRSDLVVPEKPFISGQSLMLEEWRSEH